MNFPEILIPKSLIKELSGAEVPRLNYAIYVISITLQIIFDIYASPPLSLKGWDDNCFSKVVDKGAHAHFLLYKWGQDIGPEHGNTSIKQTIHSKL